MKRLKGFLGVFFIFLFGVIVGFVLARGDIDKRLFGAVAGGSVSVVDAIENRLKQQLKLDKPQQEMLHQIVLDAQIKLSGIRQKVQPEEEAALQEAEERVRGILRGKQIETFNQLVRRSHERWRLSPPAASPAPAASPTPAAAPVATPSPVAPPPAVPPSSSSTPE